MSGGGGIKVGRTLRGRPGVELWPGPGMAFLAGAGAGGGILAGAGAGAGDL